MEVHPKGVLRTAIGRICIVAVGPSSSTCGVPPVAPNVISSTAINISLTTEETNFTISTQSISREAPVAAMLKIKPGQANIIQW